MEKINIEDVIKASEDMKSIIGYDETLTKEWNGITIEIKKSLPLLDELTLVDRIVDFCFADNGEYMPEFRDFAIRKSIIDLYTNVSLPDDVSKCHEILYKTNLVETVVYLVDRNQLDMAIASANEKTKYMTRTNIGRIDRKLNEFVSVIEEFAKNFDGIDFEEFQAALNSLQDLGSKASAVVQQDGD